MGKNRRPEIGAQPHAGRSPSVVATPRATKVPAVAPRTAEHSEHKVVWKLEVLDFEGPFGWKLLAPTHIPDLLQKIRNLEQQKWVEIDRSSKQYHYISANSLSSAARKRLEELQLDDGADLMFSFRLDGTTRIYGLRKHDVFCVLWWDPDHKVCPSVKKHT